MDAIRTARLQFLKARQRKINLGHSVNCKLIALSQMLRSPSNYQVAIARFSSTRGNHNERGDRLGKKRNNRRKGKVREPNPLLQNRSLFLFFPAGLPCTCATRADSSLVCRTVNSI